MIFKISIPSKLGKLGLLFCLCSILWGSSAESKDDLADREQAKFHSKFLRAEVLYWETFMPGEAEAKMLPYMRDHREFFKDKTVLDIGTGSGIIGLYAAKLGAKKIVATDIEKAAIECTQKNSQRLNFSHVIEARYVPPGDISAYAVIKSDETFDIIISNPPYSLILDAPRNTEAVDTGDLGFSIIKGLEKHLKPDGRLILLYDSFFYHEVMVKFARYRGYEVEHSTATWLEAREAKALFDCYLAEVLKSQNIPLGAFKFDMPGSNQRMGFEFIGGDITGPYRGLIIISRKKQGA